MNIDILSVLKGQTLDNTEKCFFYRHLITFIISLKGMKEGKESEKN